MLYEVEVAEPKSATSCSHTDSETCTRVHISQWVLMILPSSAAFASDCEEYAGGPGFFNLGRPKDGRSLGHFHRPDGPGEFLSRMGEIPLDLL